MIDRKYQILAVNPCTGTIHTENDSVLFSGRDMFLLNVLAYYHDQCKMGGADSHHLESIQLLHSRVAAYQKEYGTKLPDTDNPCEIDRCIKGVGLLDKQ